MPKSDTYYTIDESTPKNPIILKAVKEAGGLRKLAKKIGISPTYLSWALNKKYVSRPNKIQIAKYLGMDSAEIFN